jgi:hypothetical protein
MNTAGTYASLTEAGRGAKLWLGAIFVSAGLLIAVAAGPVSNASAVEPGSYNFCEKWEDPWQGEGQFHGRCDAPDSVSGYKLLRVSVFTYERAGCVDYADVWHNIMNSWSCTTSNSQKDIYPPNDGGWYRGIIRNNNTSKGGNFAGNVLCCIP